MNFKHLVDEMFAETAQVEDNGMVDGNKPKDIDLMKSGFENYDLLTAQYEQSKDYQEYMDESLQVIAGLFPSLNQTNAATIVNLINNYAEITTLVAREVYGDFGAFVLSTPLRAVASAHIQSLCDILSKVGTEELYIMEEECREMMTGAVDTELMALPPVLVIEVKEMIQESYGLIRQGNALTLDDMNFAKKALSRLAVNVTQVLDVLYEKQKT